MSGLINLNHFLRTVFLKSIHLDIDKDLINTFSSNSVKFRVKYCKTIFKNKLNCSSLFFFNFYKIAFVSCALVLAIFPFISLKEL